MVLKGIAEIEAQYNAKVQLAAKRASEQAVKEIETRLRRVADEAINEWYGGYGPKFYTERGALRDYSIQDTGDGLLVDISQQIANHQGNDYVIGIVVEQGYHGGSEGGGGIRWRTPMATGYTEDGRPKGFNRWGAHAPKSTPIAETINAGVDTLNKEAETLADQIFDRELDSIW